MNLADWLAHTGETVASLARRCGVEAPTVHRWKTGQRTPRPAQMEALTRATSGLVTANDFQQSGGFAEAQASYVADARALGLDPGAIAARALRDAVRAEKARRWAEENREAMEAQNAWIEQHGLPLAKYRMF